MKIELEVLLALEPEELAAHLLRAIRVVILRSRNPQIHLGNQHGAFSDLLSGEVGYPPQSRTEVATAIAEAWASLEVQGLLVPPPDANLSNGFRVLSRRAHRLTDVGAFIPHQIARRLDREMLNIRIREEVWAAFIRRHFETAALIAMKAVEVAVRDASGFGNDTFGRVLMQKAFNPDNGLLTDATAEESEKISIRKLFTGAIGAHKNPASHRTVNLDDPTEALEVVMIANHLLRIVDRRAAANASARKA
jgi:uncharacterized protein (TIGR02391 family)